ncbi:alpha/beta hydrolase [Roseovarius sp. D0-M9]|uniref:alpha/beta hydrolase n=1 Tax=Roseovarius sp. D0-M9 TaxID=3127117 RepID=UPI0030100916
MIGINHGIILHIAAPFGGVTQSGLGRVEFTASSLRNFKEVLGMADKDLYRNRDFVPDFDEIMEETAARSRELAARSDMLRDIPYGDTPRQCFDIVLPPRPVAGAPINMFVHGGYWRAGSKDQNTLVAGPVIAAGGIAAIVGYDLMPGTRLGEIVGQIRRAARAVTSRATEFGADPDRFSVSGHSAGAHLASFLAARSPADDGPPDVPPIKGMLLVSGIYDLSGIPDSFLKDEAEMTPEESASWTPLSSTQLPCGPRIVTRGENETLPFHDQATRFSSALRDQGQDVDCRTEADLNHLTIVLALADPRHPLGALLGDLVLL